jgi:hypothetical protein
LICADVRFRTPRLSVEILAYLLRPFCAIDHEGTLPLQVKVALGKVHEPLSYIATDVVGYTQRANSPFQSLAADGNKLALFRLLRAGFL